MNFIKKIYYLENLSTPSFLILEKLKLSSLLYSNNKLDNFKKQICSTPKTNNIFEKDILYIKNSYLVMIVTLFFC
jgi:hypothetical protein